MFRGQRHKILNIFNNILTKFKFKANLNFQKFFKILLFVIRPLFGYVNRRKAKKKFIVPVPIKWHRQYKIAVKWIFLVVSDNFSKALEHKLIKEMIRVMFKRRNMLLMRRNLFYHTLLENRFYLHFR
jgi:ribosomal protein S7